YIPYADLTASAPAGAQIKVIDLNSATNPVTTTNFADIDILFISDAGDDSQRTNYVSPTNAQLGVINAAFNAGMHVVIGSDNSGTAAIGRQFAAMMGMPVTNNLASPQLRFLDTIRTVDPLQGTITSTYPLFNGLAYDTTGSAITPGIMTYQAPGECIASVNQLNTTSPQCFVGYLPRTTAAGFLIVDGNGGRIAKQIIANSSIWDEVSDCAPYAPSCGNGILDTDTGEQCDDGGQNGAVCTPAYGGSCTYCSSTCQIVSVTGPYCGDANVDPEEECDNDGQNGMQCTPAYGGSCTYCSSECLNVELTGPYCGDGNIDTGDGELCDDNGSNGV
ncbi:hypothetical protein KC640_00300, partial [Candidatus Dojkabacteria bacterium]|nr:hypothetical protein [Candidatus Dojkabacteria bacterium]